MILDKYAEQHFNAGDLVVVTFSDEDAHCRPGEVLEVLMEPFIWLSGEKHKGLGMNGSPQINGWKVAALKTKNGGRDFYVHPVVWLRPFRNPDDNEAEGEIHRSIVAAHGA